MMMIDTLMALWNQDRRKRVIQVLLTFFLMCISISLLFVLVGRPTQSRHQNQRAAVGTATVPSFGNTVVPNLTPTMSVVVGAQPTPAPTTQPTSAPTTQPTPAPTTQTPCSTTPSGATSNGVTFYTDIQQGQIPTVTVTPPVPKKHNDGGGEPMPGVTPTFSAPATPPAQSTITPGTKPGGNGWGSNCATSNSISNGTGGDVLTLLVPNIWLILAGSLLGTTLFYGVLFLLKRRMQA